MISKINTSYDNVICFTFVKDITIEDFETTVYPAIKVLQDRQGKVNIVYIVETELKEFTTGAWIYEAAESLKDLADYNRIAVVTPNDRLNNFTELFSDIMPGTFKSFEKLDKVKALEWAASE